MELMVSPKAVSNKGISVVVPTRNAGRTIRSCLEAIRQQSIRAEIVVVDNASTDSTVTIAAELADLVVSGGPERSAQRNAGAAISTGSVLAFIDADMILEPTVLEEALECVARGAGSVVIPERSFGRGYWAAVRTFERAFYVGIPEIEAARCYERDLFNRLGGFDQELLGAEDWELAERARAAAPTARTIAFANHDEGALTFLQACRKKAYYAGGISRYVRGRGFVRSVSSVLHRPYLRRPWRLLVPHPWLGAGVVGLKFGEAVFVGLRLVSDAGSRRRPKRTTPPPTARKGIAMIRVGDRLPLRIRAYRALLINQSLAPVVGAARRFIFRARRRAASGATVALDSGEKAAIVTEYGRRYGARVLVETGTYLGDMIDAARPHFDRIVSIELDPILARRAARRFADQAAVTVLQGDSGALLPRVLTDLEAPALFWLDAHFSGGITARGAQETPVLAELRAVLGTRRDDDIILVDDARCFNGQAGYPSLAELQATVAAMRPEWKVEAESDIIRIHAAVPDRPVSQ